MKKKQSIPYNIYHLESRWRNSHVLVYHGPLLSHLLGVAPSTFSMVYINPQEKNINIRPWLLPGRQAMEVGHRCSTCGSHVCRWSWFLWCESKLALIESTLGLGSFANLKNKLTNRKGSIWVLNPKIGGFYPPKWMVKIMSNEENPGWLGYIGDYTTQLYVPGSKLPLFPYNRGWSSAQ